MITETSDSPQATVRLASTGDARHIATLCDQLGYPASEEQVQRRLRQIQQDAHHAVYVAELAGGHVVGWVHVYIRQLVVADLQAEIGGLVIHERHRHRGTGRLLMEHAEAWARRQRCWAVQLRSNVIRKDAHAFYETIGYSITKTQLAFRKVL